MDCRTFLDALDRTRGADPVLVELRDHAESCRSCGVELRTRRLLGLGSHLIAEAPRAGFTGRLRARLQTDRTPAELTNEMC